MSRGALRSFAWCGLIALAAAALYLPFLSNPLVFDDKPFFSGYRFAYYATHPLGFDVRVPPYFTLAITEVLWSGVIAAQRLVSLLLHIGVGWALYRLLLDVLSLHRPRGQVAHLAAIGALVFVVHPMTVYGAAYLVQRSIVMATLFGLLSAILFLRGLRRGSHADAVSAALFCSLAVLSKEHAVLLPAAIAPLIVLAGSSRPFALKHVAIFFAACVPAELFVTMLRLGILGDVYEDAAATIALQSGIIDTDQSFVLSVVTQSGLLFKYALLWLWPDPASMSIDLRVDFASGWTVGWIVVKVAAFVTWGAVGTVLLLRRGAAGVAGFGLLYVWILYFVEFSAVRFQEPFVLYRSYLWGPGFIAVAIACVCRLPSRRSVLAGSLLAVAALACLGYDRLTTFSSSLSLWQDAAQKLPETTVPWGSRTLSSLSREYLYAGEPAEALAAAERCMRQYPEDVQCVFGRGAIHLQMGRYTDAEADLRRAIGMKPREGLLHHRLGLALEGQARINEAKAAYRRSSELGYGGGRYELERLERKRK